jgi:hypothetical protein
VGAGNHVDDADEIANDDTEMPFGSYGAHDDDGDAAVAKIFEDELKEETGKISSTEAKKIKTPKRDTAAEAELERQKLMMPKKTRYL